MHQHQICSTSEQWSWLWSLCYCICCRARIKWKFRRKAFRTKFNEKSPVWMFEETGVICFLQHKKTQRKSKNYFRLLDIYCTCQKPFFEEDTEEDEENFVIVCSKRGDWYRKKCDKYILNFSKMKRSSSLEICCM